MRTSTRAREEEKRTLVRVALACAEPERLPEEAEEAYQARYRIWVSLNHAVHALGYWDTV